MERPPSGREGYGSQLQLSHKERRENGVIPQEACCHTGTGGTVCRERQPGRIRGSLVNVKSRRLLGWRTLLHGDQNGSWVEPKCGHFCVW